MFCNLNWKRWIKVYLLAIITGFIVGLVMIVFNDGVGFLDGVRTNYPKIIYLLPFGGLLIVFVYKLFKTNNKIGSEMIFNRLNKGKPTDIFNSICVIIGTWVSHLFGASVGRTNASLQIGGGIADFFSSYIDIDAEMKRVIVLCGISASFATLYGTPLGAAFLAIEICTVGQLEIRAFLPCLLSSCIAFLLGNFALVDIVDFRLLQLPPLTPASIGYTIIISLICCIVSIIYCSSIHYLAIVFNKFKNRYLKIFTGGALIVLIIAVFGTKYAGGGDLEYLINLNDIVWYAFVIKIIITVLSTVSCYQGGLVMPTFSIGAALGVTLGHVFGLPTYYCAAIAMICLFVGVVNAKICGMIMAIELFGIGGIVYYIIAIFIADQLSLNFKIFNAQEFMGDKWLIRNIKRLFRRIKGNGITG